MPQVRVLGKGGRITGGVLCLLLALHTWSWVARDVVQLGLGHTWDVWTGGLAQGTGGLTAMPGTSSVDLGLGLLQLAAVFAAFTGAWSAGGLLAATAAFTFADRLPVIWHVALHDESAPFYAVRDFFNDDSLDVAAGTCVVAVLISVVLAVVLLAGIRPWPSAPGVPGAHLPAGGPGGWPGQQQTYGAQSSYGPPQPYGAQQSYGPPPPQPGEPLPSESPQRPTGAHAAVTALFLGVLVAFSIGWNIYTLTEGGGFWLHYFTGEDIVVSLLEVAPAWGWLTLALLCAVGAVLAPARRVSARGFSLGIALAVLPDAFVGLCVYIDRGGFFELGDAAPVAGLFNRAELVMMLVGGVALVALTLRAGVPAQPGAPLGAPGAPGAPFAPQPYSQPAFPAQQGPPGPYPAAGPVPNSGPAYGYPPPPGQSPTPPPPYGAPSGTFGPPPPAV